MNKENQKPNQQQPNQGEQRQGQQQQDGGHRQGQNPRDRQSGKPGSQRKPGDK